MTRVLPDALEALRVRSGAEAILVLATEVIGSRVVAVAPDRLALPGDQWPAAAGGHEGRGEVLVGAGPVAMVLPVVFRLGLLAPPMAVLRLRVDADAELVAVWAEVPPELVLVELRAAATTHLAPLLDGLAARQRAETDVARLRAVVGALDQAVVFVDHRAGPGMVNAAAARLLDVDAGPVEADVLAEAMRRLWSRARNAAEIERQAREVLARRDAEARDWIWVFAGRPSHLRVTTVPVTGEGHAGRLWVLDDVSAETAAAERYRLLAENATDVVVLLDDQRRIDWASPSSEVTLGWRVEDLVGHHAFEFVHDQDLLRLRAAATRFGYPGRTHALVRFRRGDGTYLWVDFMATLLEDADGRQTRVVGIRDVDAEVQTQYLLEEREAELGEAQRLAHMGSWTWDASTDSPAWSDEMLRIYGLTPGDPPPGLEQHQRLLAPADLSQLNAAVARALADGTPYAIEYDVIRPDGDRRRVGAAGEAVRDLSGTITGLRGTATDITVAHRSRQALELARADLEEAQRIARVGSWSWDLLSGAWTWSPQLYRLVGEEPGGPAPTLAAAAAHLAPMDMIRFNGQLEIVLSGGAAPSLEYDLIRRDGTVIRCLVMAEAMTDPSGAIVGVRGTMSDITEQHERRESRARRLARRAEYLARAQHTLRTNLSVVEGWSEILEDRGDAMDSEARAKAMEAIARNARALTQHLRGLMTEAAEAARAEAIEATPLDVAAAAAEVVSDYQGLGLVRTLTCSPREGVWGYGAPEALATVVRHLVENATRYVGEAGRVEVTVGPSPTPGRVAVVVSDDGPGLPAGMDVFAAFARGGASSGNGLGLHVVRTLVDGMGGTVTGANRVDGPGAEFTVTLRAAAPA